MLKHSMPHFSDFQLLRLTNPTAYYKANTQQEMVNARKYHGSTEFYDFIATGSNLFGVGTDQ